MVRARVAAVRCVRVVSDSVACLAFRADAMRRPHNTHNTRVQRISEHHSAGRNARGPPLQHSAAQRSSAQHPMHPAAAATHSTHAVARRCGGIALLASTLLLLLSSLLLPASVSAAINKTACTPPPIVTGDYINVALLVWLADQPHGLFTGNISQTTATAVPGYGRDTIQPYYLGTCTRTHTPHARSHRRFQTFGIIPPGASDMTVTCAHERDAQREFHVCGCLIVCFFSLSLGCLSLLHQDWRPMST